MSRISADAALWASAFVLAALLIVQAGRNEDNSAYADMIATSGDYVVMTTDGQNGEYVYVINNLNEQLLVYNVEQQRNLQLLRTENLREVFATMRAQAGQ